MSQPSRFYRPEYVQKYGASFAAAVAFVLDRETEFNRDGSVRVERDPADPGGTTKYGIDAGSHPGVDVANLSELGAIAIYRAVEWASIQGDQLPAGLALAMLDTAVNPGKKLAALYLQIALDGVTPDGDMGAKTLAAANALDAAAQKRVALLIQDQRAHYYLTLPAVKNGHPFRDRFLPGWLKRVDLTRAAIVAA